MASLPTGMVTLLFTDIDGSTRLLEHLEDTYANVLVECRRLVRTVVRGRGGHEIDTEGDAVFAAFPSARVALLAAIATQQSILSHAWPDGAVVRVRMGLYIGEARLAKGGYVRMDVHPRGAPARARRAGCAGAGQGWGGRPWMGRTGRKARVSSGSGCATADGGFSNTD